MDADASRIEDLLAAARAGDGEALDRLLARYRNYLRFLAQPGVTGTLGAKADASDVVQDALLQAYKHFASFEGKTQGEWGAWLRKILAREMAMLVRRYRGTASRDVGREKAIKAELDRSSVALLDLVPATSSTPSQVAQVRERGLALADALAELSDDYRQVVVCRNLRHLSWNETAEEMDRTPEAVRKLWTRALKQLGSVLRDRTI